MLVRFAITLNSDPLEVRSMECRRCGNTFELGSKCLQCRDRKRKQNHVLCSECIQCTTDRLSQYERSLASGEIASSSAENHVRRIMMEYGASLDPSGSAHCLRLCPECYESEMADRRVLFSRIRRSFSPEPPGMSQHDLEVLKVKGEAYMEKWRADRLNEKLRRGY